MTFDVENEIALLSIVINNPESVFQLKKLKPVMMSSSTHVSLITHILELSKASIVPEATFLVNYLGTKGKLDEVGGADYIVYLKGQKYDSNNLAQYEKLVNDSYVAKELARLGSSLTASTSAKDIDVDRLLNSTQRAVENLSGESGGESTSDFNSVLRDSWSTIRQRIENPGTIGIKTGIESLDIATGGLGVGKSWIIAGRPSHAKSGTACNITLDVAKRNSGVLVFSFEMSKQDLSERFLALETGIPISDIHLGLLDQKRINIVENSIKEIKNYPIYIDTNYTGNVGYMMNTVRRYKKQKDIRLVVIDYLQLMVERDSNMRMELGKVSRSLKLIAEELGITTIACSQLSRNCENRDDKRPILSDLKETGDLEADGDIIFMVYRDEKYYSDSKYKGQIELIVRKNKQLGFLGSIFCKFNDPTNKISK